MKIALFSAFYPYRGGIAQFSAMLFRALEKEHQVQAYTFKRQYPQFLFPGSSQFVDDTDLADRIDAKKILDTVNPISYRTAAKTINEGNPDIFISQYWMTFFGPSIGKMTKSIKKDCKKIAILHNVIPHEKRFFDRSSNKYFLKQNDGFVVMSDAVLEDLLLLKPDAKYLRIDHPVYNQFGDKMLRNDALEELGLNTENKYLLFFGFIRDYKGLDLLLQSMNDLTDDVHLIIAGEVYGDWKKYEAQIDNKNLKGRVHIYTKYIPDEDVRLYFSAADVCVLPYKSATQSGITAISHHFDLPIIATDVGGLKEGVEDGQKGIIVDQPHAHLISNAIKHYFTGNLKERFSEKIKADKSENNWDKFGEKVVRFAEEL